MNTKFARAIAKGIGLGLLVSAPALAHAQLSYENVNGVGLLYDSVQNITWTQDADISGQTFTYQDAQNWAAGLNYAGLGASNWQLPTAAQFTSLYDQLDGTGDKYGAQVFFGAGPDDYASNVNPEYWTRADGTDFNFYYGYPGSQPDTSLYSAWAVTTVPEPSVLAFGLLTCGLAGCRRKFGRS